MIYWLISIKTGWRNKMNKSQLTYLPTIKSSDGNTITFEEGIVRDFFNDEINSNILSLSQEDKELWFDAQKKYGDLFHKIIDFDTTKRVMGPIISLQTAVENDLEETKDNQLLNEYKDWLSKQE